MSCDQFWNSTLYELGLALEAAQERSFQAFERSAFEIAWLIRPHIKRRIRPRDIFCRPSKSQGVKIDASDFMTREAFQRAIADERERRQADGD